MEKKKVYATNEMFLKELNNIDKQRVIHLKLQIKSAMNNFSSE